MKFFAVASAACISLLTVTGVQAASPGTVVSDIKMLTRASSNLQQKVASINLFNFALVGPQIAQGLQGIASAIQPAVQHALMPGMKREDDAAQAFGDADAELVVQALTTFVQVHQALLSTLIGKHGLITLIPFAGPPVAAALRGIEGGVDTYAYALIVLIPTRQNDGNNAKFMLDSSLDDAISTYN